MGRRAIWDARRGFCASAVWHYSARAFRMRGQSGDAARYRSTEWRHTWFVLSANLAWLPPILVLVVAVGFTVYCLVDIARAAAVRHLPKWAWVLICVLSEPLGGIVYLIVGRDNRARR